MSTHPHSASKLLPTFSSSVSSASSDQHKLTRGSCTGLLFQLFDWNSRMQKKQLFRHKSLPAERPAGLTPKKLFCCKEKSLSAEMSNTSDEASTPCDKEGHSEDAVKTDQTPEKKRKKRSPNVVAKLMGLETMPSPDLRREKWPIHHQHLTPIQNFAEKSFLSNSRVPSSRRSLVEIDNGAKSNCSSRWAFSAEPISQNSFHIQHNERARHDEARCQAARTHQGPARKIFTNLASAQSSADAKNGACGRVLSSSNTHNKNTFLVQSDVASNITSSKVAHTAPEQNMQARHALFRLGESNAVSNDNEKENVRTNTHRQSSSSKEHCDSSRLYPDRTFKQDKKIAAAANLPATSNFHAANRQNLFSAANMNIKEDAAVQKLKQHQVEKDDKESVKCHSSQQNAESGMERKEKPHIKRLDNTRRPLNEASGIELQSKKPALVKLEVDPSSSKTTAHHHESHEPSSASSILSTITQKSDRNSHDLSKQRRLSRCGKAKESKMKSNDCETSMKLPYTRGAGIVGSERSISRGRIRASKCKTVGSKTPVELRCEDFSRKSCIAKESILVNGSIEQDIASCNDVPHENMDMMQKVDNVLDEIALSEDVHESDESQIEAIRENLAFTTSSEITGMNFDTQELSSDISVVRNVCDGSCNSSLEEIRDTASSCDIHSTHRKKQTVSYSGKSTATILQELLSALNSSARLPILENEQIQQESEVSGVTSTTMKRTEDALNNSSSCIEEEDFNSLALSPLASNVCSQMSARDSGSNIECWQMSPTSSLVSPSNNLQCISSDHRKSLKDGCDCWHAYSECMHSPTNDVPQETGQIIQSEEDYVDSIIRNVKLPCNDVFSTKLKADDDFVLDAALFHKLEETISYNWKWRAESEVEGDVLDTTITEMVYHDKDAARDYRKLMFDTVQEALSLDVGFGEHLPQEACCKRVLKHIHDWKGVRCGMNVDDMVENAMNTGAGKWVDFSCEHGDVAEEVGTSIYNDMVDELVHDLVSCSQAMLDAKIVKKERLGRLERKKLIWVGL